ncbi:SMI1/KNR4 family protein [Bacillus sp. Hm123]|uniref:SMI1/KNR4 family protein n=1 Tax=Bacillus sp. Hm123 TaxID=3450745 RepID=UPI003F441D21
MKSYVQGFWDESDYFTLPIQVTKEMIGEAEQTLGYKLPNSYIELIKMKNGGSPVHTCYLTTAATSWAEDHIAIDGIRGIGGNRGIDSEDERSTDEEWGYPIDIGFVICDCPSAGHDAVMLDYSLCGKNGEPRVIHVDVEGADEPTITVVAKDFETFVGGLVSEEEFDE